MKRQERINWNTYGSIIAIAFFLVSCSNDSEESNSNEQTPTQTTDEITSNASGIGDVLANADFQKFIEKNDKVEVDDLSKHYLKHERQVNAMIELSDGRIASADAKAQIHVWDADDTSVTQAVYTGHTDEVTSLLQLSDGRIASGGDDSTIRIWDPENPDVTEATYQPIEHGFVYSMIELPDKRIATGFDQNGTVRIWHPDKPGVTEATYSKHRALIWDLALLPDGRIASITDSGSDTQFQIWDPNTLETDYVGNVGTRGRAMSLLDDGRLLIAGNPNFIIDPAHPEEEPVTFEQRRKPVSFAQLKDGRVASGDHDGALAGGGRLYVWDPNNPDDSSIHKNQGGVSGVLALSDGRLVMAGGSYLKPFIRIWDPAEL